MEQLAFACIAPHGWLTVPLVSGADGDKAVATRAALTAMGRDLAAARPETIVLLDPHGLQVEGTIALLDSARVHGETGGPANRGATAHTYSLRFAVDRALNAAIAAAARAADLPVARVQHALEFLPLPLDYGSMAPLWYLGATMMLSPRLVVACLGPGISHAAYLAFGRALRAAVRATDRRIALIASADMAHRHTADGPYGYAHEAADCDARVVEAVAAGRLGPLLEYDEDWLAAAFTDAIAPLLIVHGVNDARPFQATVLSYEVPTYFGMLCATFATQEP